MNTTARRHPFLTFLGLCLAAHSAAAQEAARRPVDAVAKELAVAIDILSTSYVSPVSTDDLVAMALKGLLRELDADGGEYFDKEDIAAMLRGQSAVDRTGCGVLARRGTLILVPVAGGPAHQAGLRARDRLMSIDGRPVAGLRERQVLRLLEGAAGSSVRLTVARDGAVGPLDFQVTRAVAVPTVSQPSISRPAPSVAMLRVRQFNAKTLEEVAEQLGTEWQAGEFGGLILDLRGSPGGLLDTTVGLAAMFLTSGDAIGRTMGRVPEANQNFTVEPLTSYLKAGSGRALASLPPALRAVRLVVLVDEATSSGAEMVVAALQDHRRASVIGRPTLGRGSIQTIRQWNANSAIKFTTAYWLTPSGRPLDELGVTPDRIVAEADEPRIVETAMQLLSTTR